MKVTPDDDHNETKINYHDNEKKNINGIIFMKIVTILSSHAKKE